MMLFEKIPPDTNIITYCDGVECKLSDSLAKALKEAGFLNVKVLHNGLTRWKKSGFPIKEKGKDFVEKYFNPLLKFETHIVSFEDCYKYPSRKIDTLIIHPFCEKQFKRTWFYPWRIIRVLSRIFLRILRIVRIIKKEKIKLVRAYGMSMLSFSGLVASKITRIPFVISLHNDYDKMFKLKGKLKGLLWHWFEKFIIMLSLIHI